MKWIPKGGMCASCKRKDDNCSGLDFRAMPHLIVKYEEGEALTIVRCTEFEKGDTDEDIQP
jgi:hypothetical protein